MATLYVPRELLERLRAAPRPMGSSEPLTDDEREHLALHLEWLAATVREGPVREASWSMDRELDYEDPDLFVTYMFHTRVAGPPKYTVEVQLGSGHR